MDQLIYKHQFGNFTTIENKTEGYPLDQEALSMLQNNTRLLASIAGIVGSDYVILTGCGTSGARVPGYVYIKGSNNVGEVLYYDGSAPTSGNLHIVETTQDIIANSKTYPAAIAERYLAGGPSDDGQNNYSWASFRKLTLAELEATVNTVKSTINSINSAVNSIKAGVVPVGSIQPFVGGAAPSANWRLCNGDSVRRVDYPDLAAVMGITATTFNLPDYRGRFLVGMSPSITDFNNVGKYGGNKEIKLAEQHIPPHQHYLTTSNYYIGQEGNAYPTKSYDNDVVGSSVSTPRRTINTISLKTGSWGTGTTAVPTLPPYMVVNFIIRVK